MELKSDNLNAINSLAWVRANQENQKFCDPDEAVRLAERACSLSNFKNPALLDTLAAAYAASGRFSDAVATAEKALELTPSSNKELAERIQDRLRLYKTGRPYVQP